MQIFIMLFRIFLQLILFISTIMTYTKCKVNNLCNKFTLFQCSAKAYTAFPCYWCIIHWSLALIIHDCFCVFSYLFHVMVENGLIYLAATDTDIGRRKPYGFLGVVCLASWCLVTAYRVLQTCLVFMSGCSISN